MIHSNVVHIIIREHVIPCVWAIIVKSIMENKSGIWIVLPEDFSYLLIVRNKPFFFIRVPPRLIHRFEGTECRMISPSFDKLLRNIN
jgi:hypothetical protein